MILLSILIFVLLSYLSNYYKKNKIIKKLDIINEDYIILFDNIISIIDYNNNIFSYINLTNDKLINHYASSYNLNKKNIISNNNIIFINKFDKILLKYNNIIIVSLNNFNYFKNKIILNNKYYIYNII